MAKRHQAGKTLLSQVRRCQELLLARSGADEFYETIRLIVAKAMHEQSGNPRPLTYKHAQQILIKHARNVSRFVEGEPGLSAPEEVIQDCLAVLAPTQFHKLHYEAVDAAFEGMTSRHYKSDKGQFFTPRNVIDLCIDVLRPRPGELVCDPASGSAAFLQSAYRFLGKSVKRGTLFGFDISRRAEKTANLMSFLGCNDELVIQQIDSLTPPAAGLLEHNGQNIEHYMKDLRRGFRGFDVIATNPPFAGDVSNTEYAMHYELARVGGAKLERDVLFLERCVQLLRPGGRLAIVLPDNKISSSKFAPVRRWLLDRAKVVAVISLHSYTFRPHTSQKAAVLFAEKRGDASSTPNDIFLYRSDKPGKRSNGDPLVAEEVLDHDLPEIANDLVASWKH